MRRGPASNTHRKTNILIRALQVNLIKTRAIRRTDLSWMWGGRWPPDIRQLYLRTAVYKNRSPISKVHRWQPTWQPKMPMDAKLEATIRFSR